MQIPIFETERLILREIRYEDDSDFYEYAKSDLVGPRAGWEPHESIDYTRFVIKMYKNKTSFNQLGVFAIILKENNKMIGTCELHSYKKNFKAELGYSLNPKYWGFGYAYEASKELIKWGFETLNLKRIECNQFVENHQSERVCEKLNLRYEGIRRKSYLLYNGYIGDLRCYAICDDEYFKDKYYKE